MFFQKIYGSWRHIQKRKYQEILDTIGRDFFRGKILDIGCGSCYFEEFLKDSRIDAFVIGLDASSEAINERKADIPVVLGDGNFLPFEEHSFDIAVSFDSMHKINTNDFRRVLRNEGYVIFSIFFNPSNKEERKEMLKQKLAGFDIVREFGVEGKENEYVVVAKKTSTLAQT